LAKLECQLFIIVAEREWRSRCGDDHVATECLERAQLSPLVARLANTEAVARLGQNGGRVAG
jgi:hypothetical protein